MGQERGGLLPPKPASWREFLGESCLYFFVADDFKYVLICCGQCWTKLSGVGSGQEPGRPAFLSHKTPLFRVFVTFACFERTPILYMRKSSLSSVSQGRRVFFVGCSRVEADSVLVRNRRGLSSEVPLLGTRDGRHGCHIIIAQQSWRNGFRNASNPRAVRASAPAS